MKAKNNTRYKKFNKKKKRKSNNPTKKYKIYSYQIKTPLISYVTPAYTEQNLRFDVYDLLRDTEVFKRLEKVYLQYKLKKVVFTATPRAVTGTDPAIIWIYLDTSGLNNFNYSAMQELQGSRSLPVKHFSLTSYSTSGRQNDFNYWYDVQTEGSDVTIRLHSEIAPSTEKRWQFQINFYVDFRGFAVTDSNQKENQVKIIQESESIKQEQGNKEDDDWEAQDSDWEENVD